MTDTFDFGDAYKALKVITETPAIRTVLTALDPKALEQADKAVAGTEEALAGLAEPEGTEYVVDLYIPFTAVTPPGMASTPDEAEAIVRGAFIAEGLYERLVKALDDTVFGSSDSEWRAEVGEG